MSKVTVLPYVSPRCKVCGRDLPRGRKGRCYTCLPPRTYGDKPKPKPEEPYTLEDRVAQATAYGLSYGNFMAIIKNGGKLPPLKRPIVWPQESSHAGE